jgi:hypothetical protein
MNIIRILVTIDGFWIDERIYWTLWDCAWLHFTGHCYTRTLVSTVASSLPLFGSGFQRRTFPFLWVPERSQVSATSFLRLIPNSSLTNSPINSLQPLKLKLTLC